MEKQMQIISLVSLARNAHGHAKGWKYPDNRYAHRMYRCRGERDGLILAARMLKGFDTQARTANRMKVAA